MRYYTLQPIDADALGQLSPGAIHPALTANNFIIGLFANYLLAKPLIGAAGFAEVTADPIYDFFFMWVQPEHRRPILFKYIAGMLKAYEKYTISNNMDKPMMTICDDTIPNAAAFLTHLGFRYVRTEDGLAIWGKYG